MASDMDRPPDEAELNAADDAPPSEAELAEAPKEQEVGGLESWARGSGTVIPGYNNLNAMIQATAGDGGGGGFWDRYAYLKRTEQARQEAAANQHPGLYYGGAVTTGIASIPAGGAALKAAGLGVKGATAVGAGAAALASGANGRADLAQKGEWGQFAKDASGVQGIEDAYNTATAPGDFLDPKRLWSIPQFIGAGPIGFLGTQKALSPVAQYISNKYATKMNMSRQAVMDAKATVDKADSASRASVASKAAQMEVASTPGVSADSMAKAAPRKGGHINSIRDKAERIKLSPEYQNNPAVRAKVDEILSPQTYEDGAIYRGSGGVEGDLEAVMSHDPAYASNLEVYSDTFVPGVQPKAAPMAPSAASLEATNAMPGRVKAPRLNELPPEPVNPPELPPGENQPIKVLEDLPPALRNEIPEPYTPPKMTPEEVVRERIMTAASKKQAAMAPPLSDPALPGENMSLRSDYNKLLNDPSISVPHGGSAVGGFVRGAASELWNEATDTNKLIGGYALGHFVSPKLTAARIAGSMIRSGAREASANMSYADKELVYRYLSQAANASSGEGASAMMSSLASGGGHKDSRQP